MIYKTYALIRGKNDIFMCLFDSIIFFTKEITFFTDIHFRTKLFFICSNKTSYEDTQNVLTAHGI